MTTINFTEAEWRQDKKGTWLSVLVDSPSAAKQFCETQEPGKKYTAEFRERRKKRSLDANYGSSKYDTRQMSRLIDLIVTECKEQGINTLTPREIALLKEGWKSG